jgi:hypothetical protein
MSEEGEPYYENVKTGTTQWEMPVGFIELESNSQI